MKTLILVRHTENFKEQPDGKITENGKTQAGEIKEFLKSKSILPEIIFTSLYKRTIQTAERANPNASKIIPSASFNEYYTRTDKTDAESTTMGITRVMPKIFSFYDLYDTVMIVAHSSINKSILQSFLNITFDEAKNYFNSYGETQIIRYDYKQGDNNWRIVDSFTPKQ